jgi:hypothetical protein
LPSCQLGRVKVRKKSPRGGPYYSAIVEPREIADNGVPVSASTADLIGTSAIGSNEELDPMENCDIKETVEMVLTS